MRDLRPWLFSLLLFLWSTVVISAAPTVTVTSLTRNVLAPGLSVNLAVSATGSGTVTYQWLRKGKAIAGATSTSLAITNASRSDSGWYVVDATDVNGTKRSKPIFVSVVPAETEVLAWGMNSTNQTVVPAGLPRITAISATDSHTLALTATGTLAGWGYYSSDYSPLPTAEDGFVAISAGGSTNMALRADGKVVCWRGGTNKVPTGLTDVVSIATTGYSNNSCYAVKSDGTVIAWNSSSGEMLSLPSGLSGVIEVSAGWLTVDALKDDGTIVELDSTHSGVPPQPLAEVVQIAPYNAYTTVLKTDGTVQTFGGSAYYFPPIGLANVVSVATGNFHFLALKADGTVAGWGENAYGQSTTSGLNHIWAIAAGSYFSVGLRAVSSWNDIVNQATTFPPVLLPGANTSFNYTVKNAGVTAWTANHQLVLKDSNGASIGTATLNGTAPGQSTTVTFPLVAPNSPGTYVYHLEAAEGGTAFGAIQELVLVVVSASPALGNDSAFGSVLFPAAITVDSSISFGATVVNTGSQAWDASRSLVFTDSSGTTISSNSLNGTAAGGFLRSSFSFTAPATPGNYTYHLRMIVNGSSFGEDKTLALVVALPVAPAVTTLSSTRNVLFTAQDLNLAVDASGEGLLTYQWKHNGRVIAGATSNSLNIPSAGYRDAGWYRATVTNRGGATQSKIMFVQITPDTGTRLVAWGASSARVLLPFNLTDFVSIGIGSTQSVGVRRDGTIRNWGESNLQPPPSELTDVVMVAPGVSHGLALRSTGKVVAWGFDNPVPADLQDVVAVACNAGYSLALRSDGTVVAWGFGAYGQTSVPAGLSHVVEISAGIYDAFAIKDDGTVVRWGTGSPYNLAVPPGLGGVTGLGARSNFVLAAKADGTVAAWSGGGDSSAGTVPAGLAGVAAVAAGTAHALALKADGTVVAWGSNLQGQCTVPASLANVIAIGGGDNFSVALVGIDPSWVAPTITTQPSGQLLAAGQSVTFTAAAGGMPTPTYQWQKNNVDIDGATGSSYSIANVGTSDAATYTVIATNYVGMSTSQAAVLVVRSTDNQMITTSLPVGINPGPMVVNPTTNKVYVLNQSTNYYTPSHTVTVIDGATNTTLAVDVGTAPYAIALNPVTNKIYVTGMDSSPNGTVTVIDGATNNISFVTVGYSPKNIAVNPVTNKIYVANESSFNVTVIDGATNATVTVALNFGNAPEAIAVNPITNKIYVATNANKVTVIDGATNTITSVVAGSQPVAIAVNSVTNKIYVANYSGSVTVIDGATNTTTTVAVGRSPRCIGVNENTNMVYVVGNPATVIDGATNTAVSVMAPSSDMSSYVLAVDPVMNRAYVASGYGNIVTKIEGATNSTSSVAVGQTPNAIAVNPATSAVYVANLNDGTVTVITWLVPPVITTQPTGQTTAVGNPVTFFATASGIPAPTVQWKKDGVNIDGATGSTYSIAHPVMNDAGSYTVVASSAAGTVTSNSAVLTVVIVPPGNAIITISVE